MLNDSFQIVSTSRRFAVQPATILTEAGRFTLEIGHCHTIQVMEKSSMAALSRRFRDKVMLSSPFGDIPVVYYSVVTVQTINAAAAICRHPRHQAIVQRRIKN